MDGRFSQEQGGALSHVPLLSLLASRLGDSDEEVMRESVFLFFCFYVQASLSAKAQSPW